MPAPTRYTLTYPTAHPEQPPTAVRFTAAPDAKGTWTVERQPYGAAGRMPTGDQPRQYFGDDAQARAEAAYRGLVVRECLHLGQLLDVTLEPRDIRFHDGHPTIDGMDAGQWLEALGTD
ncbi:MULTISPECIES: hypothetical protein [unclassified Kitasatospora]|uniref:hypothetical protein n=1 Tax=Kitasatospora sp. NPDC001261 TaxID=3364012 RepID=UPI0036B0D408